MILAITTSIADCSFRRCFRCSCFCYCRRRCHHLPVVVYLLTHMPTIPTLKVNQNCRLFAPRTATQVKIALCGEDKAAQPIKVEDARGGLDLEFCQIVPGSKDREGRQARTFFFLLASTGIVTYGCFCHGSGLRSPWEGVCKTWLAFSGLSSPERERGPTILSLERLFRVCDSFKRFRGLHEAHDIIIHRTIYQNPDPNHKEHPANRSNQANNEETWRDALFCGHDRFHPSNGLFRPDGSTEKGLFSRRWWSLLSALSSVHGYACPNSHRWQCLLLVQGLACSNVNFHS